MISFKFSRRNIIHSSDYNRKFNAFFPNVLTFLLSLTHVIVEKSLFFSQIFEMEILVDLHVVRASKSKNHIFSAWCVCICMCLCVCYQHNTKTNYSRNIKFGILRLYYIQMPLETFYDKNPVYRDTQKNFNTFRPVDEISYY